jgi:signal transduction histidine kinase
MSSAVGFVTALTATAFVALGIAAGADWLRHRERRRGLLAWSLLSLAGVAGLGQVTRWVTLPKPVTVVVTALTIALFMATAYFVLLFRDSFIPLNRRVLRAATVVTAAAVVAFVAIIATPLGTSRSVMALAGVGLVFIWTGLMGEPLVRFWIASRPLPRVQRQRMRALSTALAVLVLILLVNLVAGSARNPALDVTIQLVALAMVPVFWVSIAPPAWLRRQWRSGEDQQLRRAVTDLLNFSPGRIALAEKAIMWAARGVGGSGALLADTDGTVLATTGLDPATVDAITAAHAASPDQLTLTLPDGRTAIVAPLPLEAGPGLLAVLGGQFTPVFGSEETTWLSGYGGSVTAGLERARVTERLAAMERTKTQFLNLASHELRGPLTVIRGYVSMLEHGALGPLNEDGKRAIQIMSAKATEMNSLVEQMLEAARLEEGRLELHLAQYDLRDVVQSSVELVRPLVDPEHPITVNMPDRPVAVEVDMERIQTILTNLVDNAVKYSPQGGGVRVEVVNGGSGAAVTVQDQGVGIDAADMPRLFTRFGRIATAATSHLPGTGLGLYLSRELARLHGGDITVESKPGQGSTFTLRLPSGSS